MTRANFTSPQYTEEEKTLLLRLHAEGKTNAEIYPYLPHRPCSGIDKFMEKMGLVRNYTPNRVVKTLTFDDIKIRPVAWPAHARFEDVSPTEARQIRANAPKSAPFRKVNEHYSIYGSSMAEMVA